MIFCLNEVRLHLEVCPDDTNQRNDGVIKCEDYLRGLKPEVCNAPGNVPYASYTACFS